MRRFALTASLVGLLFVGGGTDLRAASPGFPDGNYTFKESWTYTKTYSSSSRIRIRTEKNGRIVAVNRSSGRVAWTYYPNGKVTFWRESDGRRSLWTGRWKRNENSVAVTGRSGVHSGSAVFERLNSREWKMTGVHKVRGKKIGTGTGTLRRSP